MPQVFEDTLSECYRVGLSLDFIVTPDIVAGGEMSLGVSTEWAAGRLQGCKNLALAVQDGISPHDINSYYRLMFSTIFVGGTEDWKWKTAKRWVDFAHEFDMKCHIGRCGTLKNLEAAKRMGADSVDSTSFARNDSWHIIEEFLKPQQTVLGVSSA